MLPSLQTVQHRQIVMLHAIIALLALIIVGYKAYEIYGACHKSALETSLTSYSLAALDLSKPSVATLSDGNDYYVTTRPGAPGCTAISAQRILGHAADGKIVGIESAASITGTFCNAPKS